jgi:dihydrofolate reductase
MKDKKFNIIVACDLNGAIGYQNKLLWHIPEDLKFFKQKTLNTSVIMGVNTHYSIGKILPNRENIILTSNPDKHPNLLADNELILVSSLKEAFEVTSNDTIFIIGGEKVYDSILSREYINDINEIYITEIDHSFEKYDKTFDKNFVEEHFTCVGITMIQTKKYLLKFLKYK